MKLFPLLTGGKTVVSEVPEVGWDVGKSSLAPRSFTYTLGKFFFVACTSPLMIFTVGMDGALPVCFLDAAVD
jgi:hypothetical protein